MKLLILGGTGRMGRLLVAEALRRGHQVNALVRDSAHLPSSATAGQLQSFIGTPPDQAVLREAMRGCDAIVNTLNISRTSDFPWSPLRTPEDFLSQSIESVIKTARELGLQRAVVVTAFGVHETKPDMPGWFRWMVNNTNIGPAYQDHERQEDRLRASALDWTIVRPVGLTNSQRAQKVLLSYGSQPKPSLTISRLAVAKFLLDVVEGDLYVKEAVTVSAG